MKKYLTLLLEKIHLFFSRGQDGVSIKSESLVLDEPEQEECGDCPFYENEADELEGFLENQIGHEVAHAIFMRNRH